MTRIKGSIGMDIFRIEYLDEQIGNRDQKRGNQYYSEHYNLSYTHLRCGFLRYASMVWRKADMQRRNNGC